MLACKRQRDIFRGTDGTTACMHACTGHHGMHACTVRPGKSTHTPRILCSNCTHPSTPTQSIELPRTERHKSTNGLQQVQWPPAQWPPAYTCAYARANCCCDMCAAQVCVCAHHRRRHRRQMLSSDSAKHTWLKYVQHVRQASSECSTLLHTRTYTKEATITFTQRWADPNPGLGTRPG